MTPQEAIKRITEHNEIHSKKERFANHITEALNMAIKALKKQVPRKPRVDDDGWLCCPNCDETFAMFDSLNRRLLCCGCCGQKLDWSEVDAKKRSDTE
jgi:protein-arginine kinase activator protein McsA